MRRAIVMAALLLALTAPAWAFGQDLPKLDDGKVIMNWADFEKILKELLKPEDEPEPEPEPVPPVNYSFKGASLTAGIGEGFVSVKAAYAVEVLKDKEWVSVPVGGPASGVHRAVVDGSPALLTDAGGQVAVLLLGKASHQLEVSYTISAPQSPGPNSFNLPLAAVPGASISLTAPGDLSDLEIRDAVITSREKSDGKWSIKAFSGALRALNVSYTLPVPEAEGAVEEKQPPKVYSTSNLLVSIADEVTSAKAVFDYDVKHSPVSQFEVRAPKGFEVVNVTGQGVSGWKVEDGTIRVSVGYEVEGPYRLEVLFEAKRKEASGKVAIPEPETLGVERESGHIAVETRSSLEVAVEAAEGISPVDPSELPEGLRMMARYPVLYAFRFGRHPYSGSLAVTRHNEIEVLTAAIDTVNLVALFTKDGKSVTRVIYEVRNNKKQYLKIDLPEEAVVWSAFLDDEPVKPAMNDAGQTLLPLKKSGAGSEKVSFTVELIYFAPLDEMKKRGRLETIYPKADIPASEMLVTLYLPPRFKYKDFEGDLEEIEELPPEPRISLSTISEPLVSLGEEIKSARPQSYSKRALSRQSAMEKEIADEIMAQQAAPAPPGKPAEGRGRTGMFSVKFNVPLRGETFRFSKLLVMDEAPELSFRYKETGKPFPWKYVWLGARIILWALAVIIMLLIIRWFLRRPRGGGRASSVLKGSTPA